MTNPTNDPEKNGKKLISFKKFSDISQPKISITNADLPAMPFLDSDLPRVSNRPKTTKREQFMDTSHLKPSKLKENNRNRSEDEKILEKNIKFFGKIAKLPKGTAASKGYSFLENIKISKSSIWYLLVEKQNNELQMVKYNYTKGVDLYKFVSDLKSYYISKNSNNINLCKLIESIEVDGNDKYSWIKNIPLVEVDGKKMISTITEDLIKLLSS
jgi:hypothetical protein